MSTIQTIGIGAAPDDGTGDPLRSGMTKVNTNFTNLNADKLETVSNSDWSGTDLAVVNGGTGASVAADARTNLGLVIGTDVQAFDAGLLDIAGLAVTDSNIIVGDGANWVAETGATARTSLGLTIGTDVQAFDAGLLDIAGLATTDSNFIVGSGSNWVVETGATARTSLGLTIGTDVQAFDAGLVDIAGLATTDSNIIVGSGSNWVAETGDTARTSLGLGSNDSPTFNALTLDTTPLATSSGGTGTTDGGGKQTMWIPAGSMISAITNGPALGQFETTTNDVNVRTYNFDDTTNEFAHFSISFPKSWNEGVVTYEVYYTVGTTASSIIVWRLEGVALGLSDSIDTAYGSPIDIDSGTSSAIHDLEKSGASTDLTIGGTPAAGDEVQFRFIRNAASGSDTFVGDASLIGLKIFWTKDAFNDA